MCLSGTIFCGGWTFIGWKRWLWPDLSVSGALAVPNDPHRRDPDGTLRPHLRHLPSCPAGGAGGHIPPGAAEEHVGGLHHQRGREGSSKRRRRRRREAEGVSSPVIAGERRRSEVGAGGEHPHLHQGHRLALHRLGGARRERRRESLLLLLLSFCTLPQLPTTTAGLAVASTGSRDSAL